MKFLVTGSAGFIGYHVSLRLLLDGHQVTGIDNLNNYYDVSLKQARLNRLRHYNNFKFFKLDLSDQNGIASLFIDENFERVIHLGAQAGVRCSLSDPLLYGHNNIIGYINILEGCKSTRVEHLLYASSSSVYGLNCKLPFTTDDSTEHPISLYAATKKSNELMAHVYSYLYHLPTTGLRIFTAYGPWGRPDMALFKFTKAILEHKCIDVYNQGNILRDFTYIDDIVESIVRLQNVIPISDTTLSMDANLLEINSTVYPYNTYNIGSGRPIKLIDCIHIIEFITGIQAKKNFLPLQLGDMKETHASNEKLFYATNFKPQTSIVDGIKLFIEWYRHYYRC